MRSPLKKPKSSQRISVPWSRRCSTVSDRQWPISGRRSAKVGASCGVVFTFGEEDDGNNLGSASASDGACRSFRRHFHLWNVGKEWGRSLFLTNRQEVMH